MLKIYLLLVLSKEFNDGINCYRNNKPQELLCNGENLFLFKLILIHFNKPS